MTECEYHPGAEAEIKCSRCGRDICANCIRDVVRTSLGRTKQNPVEAQECVFCHSKSSRAGGKSFLFVLSAVLAFMVFNITRYFITGEIIFFDIVSFVITGVVILFFFTVSLLIVVKGGRDWYNTDRLELINGLTWKHKGDEEITINELLELPPDKMEKHVDFIINELKTSQEVIQVRGIVKSKDWVQKDVFNLLIYFGKDIEHWCWRNDLSEKNAKRVALVFVYLIGKKLMGREKIDILFDKCPFIENGTIDKFLLTVKQAKKYNLHRQRAEKLPEKQQVTVKKLNPV